jgi:iron complex outermembrane recepter protein
MSSYGSRLAGAILTLASASTCLAEGLAAPAQQGPSQDPPPPAQQVQLLKEVTVTGTRLTAGFRTPTPVMSVSGAQLSMASPNDIAAALAQVPALSDTILTSQAGTASGAAGINGQDLLNLRGLGVNRTLVLIDGQRLGTTNVADSVDINMIPQTLVRRVDIVTGGASATYGSDAVAGVVNFILDTTYQGFKADVNAGITTYGDAPNGSATFTFGHAFGDRFRLVASASLFKQGGVGLPPTGRNWNDNAYVAYPNPVAGALPTTILVPDARSSAGTYGGLITGVQGCTSAACKALVDQQFGPGGALEPYQQGADAGSSYASGGQGAYAVFGISPAEDRENAFLHTEWDATSSLTLFAEGLFDRTYTALDAQYSHQNGTTQFTIFRGNAYLPASVAAVFAQNPSLTSFTMGRYSPDITNDVVNTLEEVGRVAVGAKGAINDRWTFDTSLSQQYTVNNLDVTEPIERNLYAAADAVVDPASGQIVCNSTLQGLDPGCVPLNLFGAGSPSAAAINYVVGNNRGDTVFMHTSFAANVRGDLGDRFTLGAGPISMALGMAYDYDSADRHVDPLSDIYTSCAGLRGCPKTLNGSYGGYEYYNPGPLYGRTRATEGYAEIGIPLLKNLPLVQSLDADLAGRMTDYTVGGVWDTWKLGLRWALNDDVMLRATNSQDVRAPDVLELFNSLSTKNSFDLFPYSAAAQQTRVAALNATVGNPDLSPEVAHTSTAGIVLSPRWAPGLQTSIDYYRIHIDHAIESLAAQGVVDGCDQGNQAYCQLITVNGTPITSVAQVTAATTGLLVTGPTENIGTERTSGVDLDAAYTLPVRGGLLSTHLSGNYLLQMDLPTAISGCPEVSLDGAIGGCLGQNGYPRWQGRLSVQYNTRRYGIYAQERFIAGGKFDPWDVVGVDITRNSVPVVEYTDLTLSYQIASLGQLYLTVTNLFNRDPPVTVDHGGQYDSITSYDVYDVLGRRFNLGFRVSL